MAFGSLLAVPKDKLVLLELEKSKGTALPKGTKAAAKKQAERGCKHCPSDTTKGINKVFTKVKGRDVLVFTSAPSREENKQEELLLGDSGRFFWDEMKKVGLSEKDCDVQAAVRCFPSDRVDGELKQRDPKKEEIHCCSLYNEEAISKSKAKIYIVLGGMAHAAVLGKEFKKSRKIFWSERLQAKVYCLAHPNYFLRGQYPKIALDEFREALNSVAHDLKGKTVSQYAFVESQKYKSATTVEQALAVKALVKAATAKGIRVTVDIESDVIDGKLLMLCCGFCVKPGEAYTIIIDHPKARKVNGKWLPLRKKVRNKLVAILDSILSDGTIHKALHQGDTDTTTLSKSLNIRTKGYDYDTIYAEFLAHPDRRAYGLNAIGMQRYPQFGDYKTVILPECIPPGTDLAAHKIPTDANGKITMPLDKLFHYVGKNDLMHFSCLPLKKLVLRNCADADLTKRIELTTKKKVPGALLRIYRDAAFVLAKMTPNGPDFDYEHCAKIEQLYPPRYDKLLAKIRKIAGRKDFKPTAPKQVKWLLYEKEGIVPPEIAFDKKKKGAKKGPDGKLYVLDKKTNKMKLMEPGTGKNILELLGRKYEIARLITEFRKLGKIISTYINSFKACADYNGGRLRTKWWLTGTQTGRLSSGGEKGSDKDKNTKIVNLQNIHGDPNLQNLATPDKQWRKLYKAVKRALTDVAAEDIKRIQSLVAKMQGEKDKDKKKALSDKIYGLVTALKELVYKSKSFKRACEAIVEKYGDIRVLLGFDQGQIEVRVMAQASGDKNLIKDCMSSDIHSKVGHAMTGWGVEKIKKDKKTRTLTKNIHFGILFGLGANGLMAFIKLKDPDSTLTEEQAQELYNNYFKAYPGVANFIKRMRAFVEEHGYVENMFGFRRPLGNDKSVQESYGDDDDEMDSENEGGAFWGNQAINTPIQGAAHQLMLMAIAMLHRKKKKYKPLGVPTIEVHDYLGFKTKLRDLLTAFPLCKELLEKEPLRVVKKDFPEVKWSIPLVVEGKVGFRLGDSVDLDEKKQMHEILCDMFLETFVKEVKLDADLALAA